MASLMTRAVSVLAFQCTRMLVPRVRGTFGGTIRIGRPLSNKAASSVVMRGSFRPTPGRPTIVMSNRRLREARPASSIGWRELQRSRLLPDVAVPDVAVPDIAVPDIAVKASKRSRATLIASASVKPVCGRTTTTGSGAMKSTTLGFSAMHSVSASKRFASNAAAANPASTHVFCSTGSNMDFMAALAFLDGLKSRRIEVRLSQPRAVFDHM